MQLSRLICGAKRAARAALVAIAVLAAPVHAASYGDGVEAYNRGDYAQAFAIWLPLAEQGDSKAQFNLGFMYDRGQGVAKDDAQAAHWFRKAAEQGDAGAQYNLGNMYHDGRGVSRDYGEALILWQRAAESGHLAARFAVCRQLVNVDYCAD